MKSKRKICKKCGKRRNSVSFSKHSSHKDGLDSRCKKCVNKEAKVRNKLKKKSPKQKPCYCPICKRIPQDFTVPHKWHFDHDVKTKKFRGWLCEDCNRAIGVLGDTVDSIIDALDYLLSNTHFDTKYLDYIKHRLINSLNICYEKT